MSDKSPEMLSHYVSNRMHKARERLEYNDICGAEKARLSLLRFLEGLDRDPALDSCIHYLGIISWRGREDINSFHTYYSQVIQTAKEFNTLIRDLFKKK